ncbi:MAG: hypothetical protein NTW94_02705 [Legionellales bacterium]|nr:hypothetical protein [Legionellales bacterium]
MLEKFRSTYDNERATAYLNYSRLGLGLRRKIRNPITSSLFGHHWRMISSLAISRFGLGECEEHAFVAAHELLKLGFYDFHICVLVGQKPTDGFPGSELCPREPFHHAMIIMNDQKKSEGISTLAQFRELPDEVIVLDAYLKYVGNAHSYEEDMKDYLQHYAITSLFTLHSFDKEDIENMKDVEGLVDTYLAQFNSIETYHEPRMVDKKVHLSIHQPIKIFDITETTSLQSMFFHPKITTPSDTQEPSTKPQSTFSLFNPSPSVSWKELFGED